MPLSKPDVFTLAIDAADTRYAEALFDIAVAYAEELPSVYNEMFDYHPVDGSDVYTVFGYYAPDAAGNDDDDDDDNDQDAAGAYDDPLTKKIETLAGRSALVRRSKDDLITISTITYERLSRVVECLMAKCRDERADLNVLDAIIDIMETREEYERAIAGAWETYETSNEWAHPSLSVLQGEPAPTTPKGAAICAHFTVVR